MNQNLFDKQTYSGANFSTCGKYRFSLYRIWNPNAGMISVVGLNPSTANETTNDPTINRICSIANYNGFGGIIMLNCFPYITPYPKDLIACENDSREMKFNDQVIRESYEKCIEIVFAWGNFKIVSERGIDQKMISMFPNAKALHINKNGSPKHPLYCPITTKLISFR